MPGSCRDYKKTNLSPKKSCFTVVFILVDLLACFHRWSDIAFSSALCLRKLARGERVNYIICEAPIISSFRFSWPDQNTFVQRALQTRPRTVLVRMRRSTWNSFSPIRMQGSASYQTPSYIQVASWIFGAAAPEGIIGEFNAELLSTFMPLLVHPLNLQCTNKRAKVKHAFGFIQTDILHLFQSLSIYTVALLSPSTHLLPLLIHIDPMCSILFHYMS